REPQRHRRRPGSEPEPEPQSEPDSEPQPEADTSAEDSPAQVGQKLKKHKSFKRFLAGVALTALATIMTATGFKPNSTAKATEPGKATARTESVADPSVSGGESDTAETSEDNSIIEKNLNSDLAGEAFNGTTYNYTEYADRENKITYHAYGYNYKDQFGDRAASTKGILHMAEYEPEALASYAAGIFTDEEKQALGIKGLNMTQIDDILSNSEHGGDLQKKLLEKLKQVLEDESTNFDFYYENDTEQTNYIYFIDDNGDGVLTPSELHLGYDTKKRNHAPQVDISRRITMPDGTTKVVKMLDLNLSCGYQPNF
ncbi:MAG: hypothetical protein Q4B87_02885, partial [Candidatus Saccharibacteria bacterium]|nr:hypothetical protein [Candidatus Saccharibacteria bacterium]